MKYYELDKKVMYNFYEAKELAKKINKPVYLCFYDNDKLIDKTIVYRPYNNYTSDYIDSIFIQAIINGNEYEHIYSSDCMLKRNYNTKTKKFSEKDIKFNVNLDFILKRIQSKNGVNVVVFYKDGSQNGVDITEIYLTK